jgi:hypothetical protein
VIPKSLAGEDGWEGQLRLQRISPGMDEFEGEGCCLRGETARGADVCLETHGESVFKCLCGG